MADVYLEVHNVYPVRGSVVRTKKEVRGMDHVVEQKNKNKIFRKEIFRTNFFFYLILGSLICVPKCVPGGTRLSLPRGLTLD